ncbi:quercetin 2,3-dioxygenase [Aspergillus steynii IBT 23096]|uniref:Quercetin 2,3-dioxygenase n=1 Tax=Aspergillus steynii IBT 23096 TaxID=1392250 RepID=A0A2I2FWE9_9EURO|nr:quercetin 2,3-dioxygenase [Aspergillus steynii IBT 23096]PLB44973.1 quercetin 2,3-dioxygenase [Aspergillus steynii IBT 23096]
MNLLFLSLLPLVASQSLSDLYVNDAPSSPRPYIIPHYADSHAVTVGSQLYRFTVTGPSSDYAFTLMSTNAPSSGSLGVLPHIHQKHYENFFNFKGRFQLWAQHGDGEQQGRLLTQGDYGSVPRNTTHTFQILDPDTEMVGVVVPGGFEDLFYALGQNFSSATNTPYIPQASNTSGQDSNAVSGLESFDVYAQLDFQPRRDFANGSAPSDEGWHSESDSLGQSGKPYFVANNYGPKYLNSEHGAYQIVQPLVTNSQSQDTNFTMSTLIVSRQRAAAKAPTWNAAGAAAFEVLEGSLMIQIGDYPEARLEMGDVAFIPKHVPYRYWNQGAYAKALYVSSGREGADQRLIRGGKSWAYPTFPRY